MKSWVAQVLVTLKPSINDPQGQSIRGGLISLGFQQVQSVRAGKVIKLTLQAPEQADAAAAVDQMCSLLLANPVIEQYSYSLTETAIQPAEHAAQ